MTKEEIENQIHDFALRINSMGFLDGYSKGLDDRKKEIEKARKEGYDEGVTDTIFNTDTYIKGLNDAWECAVKIVNSPLSDAKIMEELFNTTLPEDVLPTISASEAIAKIKKYEEKQKKMRENCSILNDTCPYDIPCAECEVRCSIERAKQKLKESE